MGLIHDEDPGVTGRARQEEDGGTQRDGTDWTLPIILEPLTVCWL